MELYNNYSKQLRERIGDGERVQKISVNGGFTCPNRDGKVGTGGCTFCNNQTFVPEYCENTKNIKEQVVEGIDFFRHKYKTQKYLVYFQSYTNTYGSLDNLKRLYEQALDIDGVKGIVIGTRPDCVDSQLLDYLAELNKRTFVCVEYGIESTHDTTLKKINRGHDYECCVRAVNETAARGIETGGHIIMGLPGETEDMMMETAERLNQLPLNSLKMHQLQIIRGTKMGADYEQHKDEFHIMELDEYIDLAIAFVERLKWEIGIERFVSSSPKELLIAPQWGLKNFEFTAKIEKRMRELGAYQGKKL
ncbi:MAG: TIGR01212 family radical SAM protein [Paludibacteraceae bacterium]|nr:TIGR01212 family radical SAM protein [Paludibacteraceae bacterium]